MPVQPLEDGSDRSIDARSIVSLIVFFICNALVIYPIRIPFPLFISRGCDTLQKNISFEIPCEREPRRSSSSASSTIRSTEATQDPTNDVNIATQKPTPVPCARRCQCKRFYFPLDLRTVPVIGVLLLLASTCIPPEVVRRGIVGSGGVRPYDIMTLFTCFAYISISLDCTGLFRYLAFLIASKSTSHGGGRTLYNSFYLFFSIIGLFFGNDPLILSGTPFLAYFTQHSSIDPPTSFLFTHFQVSNLVSAFLVSSNLTNLVLTSPFGISFLSYSAWMALPTVASVVILYPLLRWSIFKKKGLIPATIYPPEINPRSALIDPFGAIFSSTIFITTVVVLIGLSAGHLLEGGTEGVWTVTVPAAGLVLIRDLIKDGMNAKELKKSKALLESNDAQATTQDEKTANSSDHHVSDPQGTSNGIGGPQGEKVKSKHTKLIPFRPLSPFTDNFPNTSLVISRLPLALLPFAFSFFILVEGLQHTGWIRVFGNWWGAWEEVGGIAGSVWLMGVLSVIGCNIFGTNIGATILLARVLQHWSTTHQEVSNRSLYGAIFALAVGSNFGAYSFVFSASLAGLLWRSILAQKGIPVSYREFVRWNTIPVVVTMIVGCLVVAGEVCVMYKT
ncbi:hypothetical protein I302_105471 [Kwoniella bestiolae CBS 10118]|uniref:Citrate transporter-like domain-containing protein n=1 Tax=Kwoniella bestiolae CBS 10118 TaxID=1296100 RepID=A0A1B9FT78_9TREE|nr:hypothetical protein I302_08753 [Kwoniella bestiolae CBS 10118]OCF21972.1 hypothetical protein I302_08753 [Kwoniella bestiolae CBS 10118]